MCNPHLAMAATSIIMTIILLPRLQVHPTEPCHLPERLIQDLERNVSDHSSIGLDRGYPRGYPGNTHHLYIFIYKSLYYTKIIISAQISYTRILLEYYDALNA